MLFSQPVWFWKFAIAFIAYCLMSLILYGGSAFTVAAWIVYPFTVGVAYMFALIRLLDLHLKTTPSVRFSHLIGSGIVLFQILTLLTSPASCVGFKQGDPCYSLIQATMTNVSVQPPLWFGHVPFLVGVGGYCIFIILFVLTLQPSRNGVAR
jgi:hypothetical protein